MVDINGDGWLDIYVCNGGSVAGDDRANELYINQLNGTFKEEAHAYGLDDHGISTQAIFFDYDHEGDLDCFVLNNSNKSVESFGPPSSFPLCSSKTKWIVHEGEVRDAVVLDPAGKNTLVLLALNNDNLILFQKSKLAGSGRLEPPAFGSMKNIQIFY
jgi:FG-GAP-like repeat